MVQVLEISILAVHLHCHLTTVIETTKHTGEMAEWSIALVLKTSIRRRIRGSNPCLSAAKAKFRNEFRFYFFVGIRCRFARIAVAYPRSRRDKPLTRNFMRYGRNAPTNKSALSVGAYFMIN